VRFIPILIAKAEQALEEADIYFRSFGVTEKTPLAFLETAAAEEKQCPLSKLRR
jgi:hypothetical protein